MPIKTPNKKVKRKSHNNDAKEVASKQPQEINSICRVFVDQFGIHIRKELVLKIMKHLGKNGKLCRSRRLIYVGIRAHGYIYKARKKK